MSDPNLAIARDLKDVKDTLERLRKADTGAPSGTVFPTSPSTLFLFYRTDLGWLCYYDGARWLTVHEYVLPLVFFNTISANTDSGNIPIPAATTYGVYVTRATVVTNAAATNNGTNFWSIQVQGLNTANSAADVLFTFNTSADAAATYIVHEGINTTVPTNKTWVRTNASKTLAPGNLTYAASFNYRLIIT
jgi:hypothetical protein